MAINCYLAMTAAEFREYPPNGPKMAWMACHFSPYGTGLSNCPAALPEGSMLILNDRTPIRGHDPEKILPQLLDLVKEFKCSGVLLDFQRSGVRETAELVKHLQEQLPCPTAVSDVYAGANSSPVFLPPVPVDVAVEDYLAPWKGREVWLEAALDGCSITLTEDGAQSQPLRQWELPTDGHWEESLCCHYRIAVKNSARFTLYRTEDDLRAVLRRAEEWGVTHAVGLYQELGLFKAE